MVSRGGRSKGCSTCRRRRVKCDETRPVCLRCKKRGLECDGPKDLAWIDQTIEFPMESSAEESAVAIARPPPQLSFEAFGETICLAYTRRNLLKGGPIELAYNMIELNTGATGLDNPGLDLLRQSILSLSVTFFGKQHRRSQITRTGYTQYGEVLRRLNNHLARPELQTTDETILTALTCMLLEIFLPTGPKNFFKHHRGLEAIMAIRGPPKEATGNTATIFRGLRILSIIGALAESKPSLYARDEWKQAPPPADADEGALLQHHIFTCLADCTQFMSERNALLNGSASLINYEPLLRRLQSTLNNLNTLYPLWHCFNESQMDSSKHLPPLAIELGITSHHSATALMLYNTAHICILQIIDSLAPSPENTVLRDQATMTIVKCLELKEQIMRESAQTPNTIGFVATKVAWQAIGSFDSPEGRKLAKTVNATLNAFTPMPSENREAWEQARPDQIRDTFFARFMKSVPTGTSVNEARDIGLLQSPRFVNVM